MNAYSSTSVTATGSTARTQSARWPALFAMLFGVFIVGMAGFSHLDAVHNASHDTRHSNGFPCH